MNQPDDMPDTANTSDPNDATPSLIARLRDALTNKRAQAAQAQREAEAEEQRINDLTCELNRLQSERQRAEDAVSNLDAEYKRLVEARPVWLEACRANWRERNFNNSMMAEVDFAIADYAAHRTSLVERLSAAQAAIKAFRRKHSV